ncbi:MAG: hypothetical protein QXK24_00225 [Ignisphaera sp.]
MKDVISPRSNKVDPVGDAVNTVGVGTLIIRPPEGYEWIIHNIYHSTDLTLSVVSPIATFDFETDPGPGVFAKYSFHMTNSFYIMAKSAGTIAADGIVSKTP